MFTSHVRILFLIENIANRLDKISTMGSTSTNSCFNQMVEILTKFIKSETSRVMQFSVEDRNIFRNSIKEFEEKLGSSLDRAAQKISSGKD